MIRPLAILLPAGPRRATVIAHSARGMAQIPSMHLFMKLTALVHLSVSAVSPSKNSFVYGRNYAMLSRNLSSLRLRGGLQ